MPVAGDPAPSAMSMQYRRRGPPVSVDEPAVMRRVQPREFCGRSWPSRLSAAAGGRSTENKTLRHSPACQRILRACGRAERVCRKHARLPRSPIETGGRSSRPATSGGAAKGTMMAKRRSVRHSAPRVSQALFQMIVGKWISQAVGTVVEIGVPDQLGTRTRSCSDLARESGVSEDGLYRLLRALASVGLFTESANRRFKLAPMGQLLRRDHPESLAGYAQFTAHDSTWRPWGQLRYSVKTGLPAFDHVFGAPIFRISRAGTCQCRRLRQCDDLDQHHRGSRRPMRMISAVSGR